MALSSIRPHASMSVGSADTIALTRSNSPALIASMNAAAAAASGIRRFYIPSVLQVVALVIAASSWVAGQTTTLPEQPLLGWALNADLVRRLPANGTPFALLDTVQNEAIGDRFVAGGLNVGRAPRFGG